MKNLYIKFKEGDKKSLKEATKEAEKLGYRKANFRGALNFEGFGILVLTDDGEYLTDNQSEAHIQLDGFKEHKIIK